MRRYYFKDPMTGEEYLAWVNPGSLRYDLEDIDFLLPWLEYMREGDYPAEPSGGYIEGKGSGFTSHAFYETASMVAAELDNRLAHLIQKERPGMDRWLVEQSYCQGVSDEDLAIRLFIPTWEVRRRIESAVRYIASGLCPRWLNCIDCAKYMTCHKKRKGRVGISYRDWVRSRSRYHGRKIIKVIIP